MTRTLSRREMLALLSVAVAGGALPPLDGWYLAPTEARVATLLDLVRG